MIVHSSRRASVYVVSWVYWSGTSQSGGGFFWLPKDGTTFEKAEQSFRKEADGWKGVPSRVRLVEVELPEEYNPTGSLSDREAVTRWLDDDIDMIETELPALRVSIIAET